MKWIPFLLVASFFAVSPLAKAGLSAKDAPKDDPKLPRVLLIGDSISIDYTTYVRQALNGKVNLHRTRENAGSTTNGLANLKSWLGKDKWDLIYFNFGLHDLRSVGEKGHVASLEEYEKNLEQIVEGLKKTGAKLIWASTTPVPNGKVTPPRRSEDVPLYNAAAKKVMDKNGVQVHDLYSLALPNLEKWQLKNNVHFKVEGYEAIGSEVAKRIDAALKSAK
jgi:lysophospholipase L1-like esterase